MEPCIVELQQLSLLQVTDFKTILTFAIQTFIDYRMNLSQFLFKPKYGPDRTMNREFTRFQL